MASATVFYGFGQGQESEAGYTANEPTTMAVTEAIDEAVKNLVVEGLRDGLWQLQDPGQAADLYAAYDRATERAAQTDYFGRRVRTRGNRPGLGIGLSGGGQLLETEFENALARPTGSLHLRYGLTDRLALGASGSIGATAAVRRLPGSQAFSRFAEGAFFFFADCSTWRKSLETAPNPIWPRFLRRYRSVSIDVGVFSPRPVVGEEFSNGGWRDTSPRAENSFDCRQGVSDLL